MCEADREHDEESVSELTATGIVSPPFFLYPLIDNRDAKMVDHLLGSCMPFWARGGLSAVGGKPAGNIRNALQCLVWPGATGQGLPGTSDHYRALLLFLSCSETGYGDESSARGE